MKVEIKDKTGEIHTGLRACGFNIEKEAVEVFLNVSDLIRNSKSDVTLKDVMQMKVLTQDLFKE